MVQAVHFCRKGPSFSEAIENVDNDAPRELNTINPGCPNGRSNIPKLSEQECVYKVKRAKSGFMVLMLSEQKNTVWIKDVLQKL